MRAAMENWFLQHWYDKRPPPWYLRALEPVYRSAYRHVQRKSAKSASRYRSRLPVIVVGNITAGGSGKTPLVIRLCELARESGIRPGIASTGYGRQSCETAVVHADSDTRTCGDEPVLLAGRTGVPVAVAAKRCDAIRLLNTMDIDLVISDDGLQQADLDRDLEFCVVDGFRGLGNGHLLPAGPLREAADRLAGVDYVVTNGEWAAKPDNLEVSVMSLHASGVCSLDGTRTIPVKQFTQEHGKIGVHAIAGIGNPQRFFRMLEALGIKAKTREFPDHHLFTHADFDSIPPDSVILMTEKDAVKCRSLGLENAWYVPVDSRLPGEFEATLKSRMAKLVEECK